MDEEGEKKRNEEVTLKKLQLLEGMMKQHEWVVFGQKDAEEEERIEAELDPEASDSAPEKPAGE